MSFGQFLWSASRNAAAREREIFSEILAVCCRNLHTLSLSLGGRGFSGTFSYTNWSSACLPDVVTMSLLTPQPPAGDRVSMGSISLSSSEGRPDMSSFRAIVLLAVDDSEPSEYAFNCEYCEVLRGLLFVCCRTSFCL